MRYIYLISLPFLIISLSQAQTIYTDTIPEEHKNLCLVYVTDDLLAHLNMTAEEFYEQKVKNDFHWLNLAHYYSGNTNDSNQIVEIVAGEMVHILTTEGLPDELSSSDAVQFIRNKSDGIWDSVNEDQSCWNILDVYGTSYDGSGTILVYGYFTDGGVNSGHVCCVNGSRRLSYPFAAQVIWILQHEIGHRYGGRHINDNPATARPTKIDTLTDRVQRFVTYWNERGKIPDGDWILGEWTVMNASRKMGLYGSPYIRTPDSESDVIRHIRETLASFEPLLKADILLPSDTLQANSQFTLSADLNRDTLSHYDYNWSVYHGGELAASHNASGMDSFVTSFDEIGQYTIELFVQKSCGGQSDSVSRTVMVVNEMTSTASAEEREVDIYPNPTSGIIHISGIPNPAKTEIYSITGNSLINSYEQPIDISSYPSGLYYLKVIDEEGKFYTQKIFKE